MREGRSSLRPHRANLFSECRTAEQFRPESLRRERFRWNVPESRKARQPPRTFNFTATLRKPYITAGRGRALSPAFRPEFLHATHSLTRCNFIIPKTNNFNAIVGKVLGSLGQIGREGGYTCMPWSKLPAVRFAGGQNIFTYLCYLFASSIATYVCAVVKKAFINNVVWES